MKTILFMLNALQSVKSIRYKYSYINYMILFNLFIYNLKFVANLSILDNVDVYHY